MKKQTVWIQKHCGKPWFAIMVNLVLLAVLLALFSPAYETNDDMGLCAIVNGAKGSYDAHMIYVNYLAGLLLSALYRLTDAVAWYALLQYAVLFCAFSAVTYVGLRRLRTSLPWWVFCGILLYFAFEGYIRLQYTKTAGIAAAAGMLLLLDAVTEERVRWRSAVCGLLLACAGAVYRLPQFFAEAALLSGIVIYELLRLRQYTKQEAKRRFLRYVRTAAALLFAVAVLYGADRLAYRSEDWQRYEAYNAARTELFDYRFPDYKKNREAYEALGIDENAYQLLRGWNHMDTEKFSQEVLEELIALKTPKSVDLDFLKGFVRKVLLKLYTVRSFWCFLLTLLVWLLSARHRGRDIAALLGELAAVVVLYFFLYYQGRYLRNRVDVGIWLAASLAVLWISAPGKRRESVKCPVAGADPAAQADIRGNLAMQADIGENPAAQADVRGNLAARADVRVTPETQADGRCRREWKRSLRVLQRAAGPALFVFLVLATYGTWEKRLRINNASEEQKQSSYREVLEYISADKEHLYITKSGAVSFAKSYGVFDAIPAGITENTLALGGWPANTPGYVEKMREYGITNPFRDMIGNEQIYLVDDEIDVTMEYLRTYYDAQAQAVLTASPGKAKIYRIE